MSWQFGAFAVLAAALVAGFAWYEVTRPDARLVALVATLAALAALGRIAFAAVPNVKPTTDIVLIAGFALGAAPGYVVGALAALSSNFFFGQGPWTPWQMLGWGLVGLVGAVLARSTAGRIGRRSLAAVCFIAGLAFTALQDVGDWVNYSDHSLAQLGVYVGSGLGFDLIHAIGCVAFALLFGQALLRSLRRFRLRTEVHWSTEKLGSILPAGSTLPILLVLVVAGGAIAVGAQARAATTGPTPVAYLQAAQNADGGFGLAAGEPSNSMVSAWAALALVAAGRAPRNLHQAGASATVADYLEAKPPGVHADAGTIERTILAARALSLNPAEFAHVDLVRLLLRRVRPAGSVADQTNLTAFAVLALRAAGREPSDVTYQWLARQADRDGGFNFETRGGASDVDDTGAVLEALATAPTSLVGREAPVVRRAVRYLRDAQDRDGGFPEQPGGYSNAQSTAFALQGLIAVGVDVDKLHRHGSPTPDSYLRALAVADGSIDYARRQPQTPTWVTAEAVLALAGKPLPLIPGRADDGDDYRRELAAAPAPKPVARSRKTTAPPARPGKQASGRAHDRHSRQPPAAALTHNVDAAPRRGAVDGGRHRPMFGALIADIGRIEGILIAIPNS